MSIVTLTTDWGLKDHYLAAVKGSFMSKIPDINIVDITHELNAFDIISASFVIKNAYKHFPEKTIHIIGVNTDATSENPHLLVYHKGHYFIGTDNGIFSLIFESLPDKIIQLDYIQNKELLTFSTREFFVNTAIKILNNTPIEKMGELKNGFIEKTLMKPIIINNMIKGNIIYIDRFENVITNIHIEMFKEYVQNKAFSISFRSSSYEITEISHSYNNVEPGDKLAIFGSTGYLEIAISQGKASSLLGLGVNDSINIIIEE